jgi:hypothetical protein
MPKAELVERSTEAAIERRLWLARLWKVDRQGLVWNAVNQAANSRREKQRRQQVGRDAGNEVEQLGILGDGSEESCGQCRRWRRRA